MQYRPSSLRALALAAGSLAALAASPAAHAGLSVTSTNYSYAQDFNSLANTGSTAAWTNDSTLPGWSLYNKDLAALTKVGVDNGSNANASYFSYGSTGTADRALGGFSAASSYFGSPANGAVAGWVAVSFTNDSGSALAGFKLDFDGEQWRNGGNPLTNKMVLEYGFGSSFSSVTQWTAPGGSFDWTSPVVGPASGAVDGNAAGRAGGLGGTVSTPWAAGDTLWVRWAERNESGNDHGLAIDNVNFSVISAVPEPHSYALMLTGLLGIGLLANKRRHPN